MRNVTNGRESEIQQATTNHISLPAAGGSIFINSILVKIEKGRVMFFFVVLDFSGIGMSNMLFLCCTFSSLILQPQLLR